MQLFNIEPKCPECSHTFKITVNTWTGEHTVLAEFKAGYGQLMAVVEHYKKLRGFDLIPTWNGTYKARAMAAAKRILNFLRKLDDPVDVAKEYLSELQDRCQRENWKGWSIERAAKDVDHWLAGKQEVWRK